MMYKGYRIERVDPSQAGNWGNRWGVFAEEHNYDGSVRWKQVFGGATVEECKRGIRGHFGRI